MSDANYIDRKVLVRGADGTVGEIQITSPGLYRAKNPEGQSLYDQSRILPDGPEKTDLEAKEAALYEPILQQLERDEVWRWIIKRLKETP